MRKALAMEELKGIYGHIAERYDFQHAFITARADQRGRKTLVEHSVSEGDRVLGQAPEPPASWPRQRWARRAG
jgi:ubiquinone/menaquinone biosynthesis C-methylase UbiE